MTTPALEALVGRVLDDHYRLDSLLGAGGMGAVYRAEHTKLQRSVAIKVLHPDVGSDPSISKRFDREATSASRLDHPNCVRVSDFGTTDEGIKYLVMELLEGDELSASTGEPWAPERACEILAQILSGLEHAHHHGIVHRDLKPENVFVTRDASGREVAKLVDFGIAKLLDSDGAAEVLTRAGMVFGTPRYMSPEQAAGGKIDERCDLYAVGVLAFEMLSGAPPFDSDDLAAILRMQIIAPPPALPDSTPAKLAAWVFKLLEKSRHERPESAAAARGEVLEILADLRERSPTETELGGATQPGQTLAADAVIATMTPAQLGDADPPLPSKPEAMVTHRVAGRFRLEALLGVGGMGAVFRALDEQAASVPNAPTHVAVKVLHAALAADEEMASRFEREAKTAAALRHPNIVPVLGHGTTKGVGGPAHYLVMPLLQGRELRDLCGAPLELARATDLLLQLLDALALAHSQGVVHRDLKPENIFVETSPEGRERIRLVDFGLAKVAEGGRSYKALTRFGQVFGTPAYMSPEQCQGEIVDARTDVYAVGAMVYELLVGQPPFVADNPLVLLGMQVHTPPPPLPGHLPPALRQLVEHMLAKDRNHRPPDAGAAAAALRACFPDPAHAQTIAPVAAASASASAAAMAPLPATTQPVLVQGLPPTAEPKTKRWLLIGGVVLALLVTIALIPKGTKPSDLGLGQSAPSEVYAELDRMISAKDKGALERIRAVRDDYPEDAALMWREGRALAQGNSSQRTEALHRYVDAVRADPDLADETMFAAELRTLLGDPKLRKPAIDIAVRELDELGHSFLIEVLNDKSRTPSYVERHRILDALASSEASMARVDFQRQRDLDLRQAHDAMAPCTAFSDALDAIAASHDPSHLALLFDDELETALGPGSDESLDDCVGLDEHLELVRKALSAEHPEAAAEAGKPSKGDGGGGGSKKKKKKFKLPF